MTFRTVPTTAAHNAALDRPRSPDAGTWAGVLEYHIDTAEYLLKWNVFHPLGVLREIAGGTVEVAALRYLKSYATDHLAPSHERAVVPLAGGLHVQSGLRH